jgi:long-chain acyl-CoA synthetase
MPFTPAALAPSDLAFLQYTGGTTGVAKGAMLTHRNVIANVLQTEAWAQPALRQPPLVDRPVIVCALPLYHIFALTACALWGMRVGALNILIPNPRDIPGFIKELKKYRINMLPAVNTLYNALVNHPDFRDVDFSALKVSNGGGMAVQQAVNDKWKAITGTNIIEGYGLSETSPVATCNRCDVPGFTGTIGLPVPSTDIAIVDDDDRHLPVGSIGEIAIRGPQVMAGYWNRPDETAKVMTADGFFKSGEAVKVVIVRKDPALTAEKVKAFCKENLTGYKLPRYIEFRNDLPKSNVGKILRRALRDAEQAAVPA